MAGSKSGPVGFFRDVHGVKIEALEPDMRGTVEARFDEDGIFRTDADGLVFEELDEPVLKAEREVVGNDPRGPEGEGLIEVVGF